MEDETMIDYPSETNARGNEVLRQHIGGDRYRLDFKVCSRERGFEQWGTDQDAWYFGIWVNRERRMVVSFVEGDLTVTSCPDAEHFAAEIASMEAFHGAPPPAFVVLDLEAGTRTDVVAQRLTASDIRGSMECDASTPVVGSEP
jgi:hypothetical protein